MPDLFNLLGYKLSLTNTTTQYLFTLSVVVLCFWLIKVVMASAYGRSLIAIRDNDVRASLIGINVYRLRLSAFVIAGFLAGVSGALFALFGRYASASYMFYHVSGEGVVWAIVGGVGTLMGPAIGTGIFILIREVVSTHWQHHALIVGAFAICIVIFAPEGIVGLWKKLRHRLRS
jgi:branched-chain amino acid transport system permease protein